jgi:Holliday junction resolvasome RuvABC ATP-dependent DNA helicase subunit
MTANLAPALLAQEEFLFHRDERLPHTSRLRAAPTEAELEQRTSLSNRAYPLAKVVGNPEARKRLSRSVRAALRRYNHVCNDLAFLFTGPKGVGKTNLARRLAESLGLPFVEISPACLKTAQDLFIEIKNGLEAAGLPLVELVSKGKGIYIMPPCVIFIDECHDLKKKPRVVTALLKAVAINDQTLRTEQGYTIKTNNVMWLMATTDRGDLFDALDDRFTEIPLNLYTKQEIQEIVWLNYGQDQAKDGKPELPWEACGLVAYYRSRHPRKALEFAREVRLAKHSGNTWQQAVEEVAKDCGIDKWGMDRRLVQILTTLGKKPVAKDRLPTLIGVKEAELQKFHLPFLICDTADQPAYITVTSAGYTITRAGLAELDKRGIPHNGSKALGER